ncbi:hypothetical protein [Azospirillum palustre]
MDHTGGEEDRISRPAQEGPAPKTSRRTLPPDLKRPAGPERFPCGP